MDASARTSMGTARAEPPSALAFATVCSAPSGSERYPMATARPARARARELALPIPREAPVTSATVRSASGTGRRLEVERGLGLDRSGHGPPHQAGPP